MKDTKNRKMKTLIKIRRFWNLNPATKVHSSPKGKKGYNRQKNKKGDNNE